MAFLRYSVIRIPALLLLGFALALPAHVYAGSDEAQVFLEKGWQQFHKHRPAHYAMAQRFFNQAKEADPDHAETDAALAALYWRGYDEFWFNVLGVGRSDARLLAKKHLEKALEEPTARAYEVDCRMKSFRAKHEEALAACRKALALAPEDPDIRHAMALALVYDGQPEEALLHIDKARQSDPQMEDYHGYYEVMARFFVGDSTGAIAALEKAISANPGLWTFDEGLQSATCNPCIFLIAALADNGRTEEAKRLVKRFMDHHIDWTITNEMYYRPLRLETDIEHLTNALRAAGVPE
ncbi:MAG: hypothetical protein R3316_00795 [Rhodovibrionaceae bacterium]|nr:hypothetical protein [Rhodovibrionaceae bacterium]